MSSGVTSDNSCMVTGDAKNYSNVASDNDLASDNKCKRQSSDISRIEGTTDVPSDYKGSNSVASQYFEFEGTSVSSLSQPSITSVCRDGIDNNTPRKQIQCNIDQSLKTLKEWRGELFLDVLLDSSTKVANLDVLQYIRVKGNMQEIYFHSFTYNPKMGFGGKG